VEQPNANINVFSKRLKTASGVRVADSVGFGRLCQADGRATYRYLVFLNAIFYIDL